mgnify:CR=1 FL=1
MPLAAERGVGMLPVDSEHSAIFQSLEGNEGRKIRKILLTASGGPFRGATAQQLKRSDAEAGPETSKLEHGKEDNHRFGDHDE